MIDKRDFFLQGEYVVLKGLTETDIIESNWFGWFNDSELMAGTQHHVYPNNRNAQSDYWRKICEDKSILQLGILPLGHEEIVGIVSLKNINYISRSADHAQIVEKKHRSINLFLESNRLIFQHAFDEIGLNKIHGGSIDRRQVDLMCRFFGFRDEGIAREAVYKNGKFHDVYRIGLLRSEFKPIKF